MKKVYEKPELELIRLTIKDVVLASREIEIPVSTEAYDPNPDLGGEDL